jgi:drug/metabolite transporter (DMT)-like permease
LNAKDWGKLLLLSFIWSASFLFAAIAVKGWPSGAQNGLPPMTVVMLRVMVASATLVLILRFMGVSFPTERRAWLAFFGMGLLNNVIPFSLIFWGQSQMPASVAVGLASILNATTPLFTVAIAHVMLADEKATATKVAGLLFGLAGVTVLMGVDVLSGVGVSIIGQLACLCAAISYGFAGLFSRRFKALAVSPLQIAFGQVTASSLMLVPLVIIFDQPWLLPQPGIIPVLAIFAMGVVATALAYILFFQILASAGATNLSLVTFLIPPSAILLGVIVLGEALKMQHLIGMAFIGLGLAAIDGRLWKKLHGNTRACRQLSHMIAAMRCIAPRNVLASLS